MRGFRCSARSARSCGARGWGGSGRNGGQVIPGLKYDPDEIEKMFGRDVGRRIVDFAGRTADVVFDLIAKHNMAVPHARNGWIQAAHTAEAIETVRERAEQWTRRGADVFFLDRVETEHHLGTPQYPAGWIDRRGGAVQPLAFARELARAAVEAGAAVHGDSKVAQLSRSNGRWRVRTEHGADVSAERVVLCTNGYTGDLVRKLRQTIIAPRSIASRDCAGGLESVGACSVTEGLAELAIKRCGQVFRSGNCSANSAYSG